MALFDRYLIVDWSGSGSPTKGKDSLWACLGTRTGDRVAVEWVENFATRHAFMERLKTVIDEAVAEDKRLLCGFDFAFGYPQGTAERVTGAKDWGALWRRIADAIVDGPDNSNNRYQVASDWNRDHFADRARFWGRPHQHIYPHLEDRKPEPAVTAPYAFRIAESHAKGAKSVWQLAYSGSVGSQSLLGIARLSRFLDESGHRDGISVWPFETGFTGEFKTPVVFAEIYPSLFPITMSAGAAVKDEVQVTTVADAFMRFDRSGTLADLFRPPDGLTAQEIETAAREEGWVLGIGHQSLREAALPLLPETPDVVNAIEYIRDPAEIYRQSFETIRREVALERFPTLLQPLAIRLIHACGMIDIVEDLRFSDGAFEAGASALVGGAPVLVDAEMVRHGIIRRLLPAENDVICMLNDERVRPKAAEIGNTRSAAQVDLWDERLDGAVVAIGNAPTALFRLLERIDAGGPRPALILGFPVGFVGAAESKEMLIADSRGVPYIAVRGRRGGSAMASAAVNALAGGLGAND